MEYFSFIVLFLFAAFVVNEGSDVIELDPDNFDSEIADLDIVLIEFFAPWCGHCKKLAPEYEAAAEKLQTTDPVVPLAKVDCDAHKDLCSRFSVSGYPTLKIFRNGELSADYSGPRDKDGIVKYMLKQASPSSKEFTTVEEVDAFIGGADITIVGFFSDKGDKDEFEKAAKLLFEKFKFAFTMEASVGEHFDAAGKVVLFRPPRFQSKFEESKIVHDGPIKKGKIEKFVKENAFGLAGLRTKDNDGDFKKPVLTAYYNVDYVKDLKGTNYYRNRVMKIAKKNLDAKLTFSIAAKEEFSRELSEYGFEGEQVGEKNKVLVAITGAGGEKYPMKEDFSVDNLDAFVGKYLAGELEPYLKSEEVPEDNDGPVKVVVAKSFNEIVNDESKDVLIEFYAPWCGHCKSLEPKYKELGEKLASDENIVIAKMDATANDVPAPYQVSGFPTIYWSPANKKDSPKKYQGGREVDDFLQYIKKEATNKPVNVAGKKKKKSEL